MATRKKAPKSRRPGLRSQAKLEAKGDETWDSLTSEGEEASSVEPPGASSKPGPGQTSGPSTLPSGGLVSLMSLMRDFLEAQQAREERYVQELQGIRESIQQTVRSSVATPSDMGSLRMELPTPGPPRVSTTSTRAPQPRVPIHRSETPVPVLQPGDDIESYLEV
ncbi:UPF0160 mitochondrial-like protein [Labeo rohita]|uniref:UPF0160 mitochondrial-like protein n=1 Tax=Labeo rohita TaxID=84645 RepID=A0A498MWU7_LABRO|nr:UPF0160 mitochondrial-like protein [Labeo rohita]